MATRKRAKLKRPTTTTRQLGDTHLTVEQVAEPEKKGKAGKSPKEAKNDICSICLNQIMVSVQISLV